MWSIFTDITDTNSDTFSVLVNQTAVFLTPILGNLKITVTDTKTWQKILIPVNPIRLAI